jgi:hypothetical protein
MSRYNRTATNVKEEVKSTNPYLINKRVDKHHRTVRRANEEVFFSTPSKPTTPTKAKSLSGKSTENSSVYASSHFGSAK